jgi:lysozyme
MDLCEQVVMFEEGFSPVVYLCPSGADTIGYGHNTDANPLTENDMETLGLDEGQPLTITVQQAKKLLNMDIQRLVLPVAYKVFGADHWQAFGEVRRAALGSMIYQLGETRFKHFTRLISCALRYDWAGAAEAALDSKWARQTPARAKRHAEALRTGNNVWRKYQ